MNIESKTTTIVIFLLISFVALPLVFIYTKKATKKSRETERVAAAEKERTKIEKEREKVMRIEETGYSERDEKEYEHDDSDNSDDDE